MNRYMQQTRLPISAILFCLPAWVMAVSSTFAEVEEAHVEATPWSGYWWPISQGEMLVPLGKYDTLVGARAAAWERTNNPPGPDVPKWFGYCHAWAASSIMESEPTTAIRADNVALGIGDQKGLLAACHANDVANSFGDRFGDKRGSEDPHDLPPDEFWMLLKRHIGQQGVPLIADIEAGEEVWNYPIYAYRVDYAPTGNRSDRYRGTISIWMADDSVPMDFVGIKRLFKKYVFEVSMRNGSVVMGTGKWLGTSRKNHPDFAWFPYVARAENPEVNYRKVTRVLGTEPAGANRPSHTGEPADTPTPTPTDVPASTDTSASTSVPMPPETSAPADVPTPTDASTPAPSDVPGEASATAPTDIPGGPPSDAPSVDLPAVPLTGVVVEARPEPVLLDPIDLVSLIATRTSDFALDITVDRFDGGKYREGDLLSIAGKSARNGYLYLLAVDTEGVPSLLYPQPGDDNRVEGGMEFEIPARKSDYQFRLFPPFGDYRIKAIVCEKALEFSGLVVGLQQHARRAEEVGVPKESQTSDVAINQQGFRWNPTQCEQVKELLTEYKAKGKLSEEQVDHVDPHDVLGGFAQDEVAFYVGRKTGK